MLPKEQGGVVDAHLRVYGLDNVRVVDSSIFPIEFAAHMMAPTYGLAEQAADMIKADYANGNSPSSGNSNGNSNGNGRNAAYARFSSPLSAISTLLVSGLVASIVL